MKLRDLLSSGAFVVASDESPLIAVISGPYIDVWFPKFPWLIPVAGQLPAEWDSWSEGPWRHDLGTDGLHGADAADLYDEAVRVLGVLASGRSPFDESNEEE